MVYDNHFTTGDVSSGILPSYASNEEKGKVVIASGASEPSGTSASEGAASYTLVRHRNSKYISTTPYQLGHGPVGMGPGGIEPPLFAAFFFLTSPERRTADKTPRLCTTTSTRGLLIRPYPLGLAPIWLNVSANRHQSPI